MSNPEYQALVIEWNAACRRAERWNRRAAVLQRKLALARAEGVKKLRQSRKLLDDDYFQQQLLNIMFHRPPRPT